MHDKWIKVLIKEGLGGVYVDGWEFSTNDVFPGKENSLGMTLTLRDTDSVGRHFVVYYSLEECPDPEDYAYTMRCNIPGTYFLGEGYGYRKKSAEEESCPLRREFRMLGLSVDRIHPDRDTLLVRSTTSEKLPIGNRYLSYITDAKNEQLVDERFGRDTIALSDFMYVICTEEEEEKTDDGKTVKFKWISGVHLSPEVTEEALLDVAHQVRGIMKENVKGKSNECD